MRTLSVLLLAPKFQNRCYGTAIALFLAIVVMDSLPGARVDIGQLAFGGVLHSVACAAMGAIDECVQSFFTCRTAAVGDCLWLAD